MRKTNLVVNDKIKTEFKIKEKEDFAGDISKNPWFKSDRRRHK